MSQLPYDVLMPHEQFTRRHETELVSRAEALGHRFPLKVVDDFSPFGADLSPRAIEIMHGCFNHQPFRRCVVCGACVYLYMHRVPLECPLMRHAIYVEAAAYPCSNQGIAVNAHEASIAVKRLVDRILNEYYDWWKLPVPVYRYTVIERRSTWEKGIHVK